MSSLGQLSNRLDRHLQTVRDLNAAVLALRAELVDKLDLLKITSENLAAARVTLLNFLGGLGPVLAGSAQGTEEQRLIVEKLTQGGEVPADWAEDFAKLEDQLRAGSVVEASQLDKIMRVVGYLQGEVAEDVRRLRSR